MANRGAGTYEVDPISRIEGHLGVKVTTDSSGVITDARAHGNLWRGFENFLLGRQVNDAITFTQRICGVCPVPHGLTATHAADAVLGYSRGHITFANTDNADKIGGVNVGIPPKAVLIRNLVLGAEFLMSSITHFYHLAAPSYVQGPAMPPWTPFFDNTYYHAALQNPGGTKAVPSVPVLGTPAASDVWDAVIISYVRALKIRRLTFEAGALFAGRMPMTSCFVAGGVTNDGTENLAARITQFRSLIQTVGAFIINEYVPIALVLGMLYPENDSNNTPGVFAGNGMKTNNRGIGAGLGRFLAWGGMPNLNNSLTFPGGIKDTTGALTDFTVLNKAEVYSKFLAGTTSVPNNLTEDIETSKYAKSTLDATVYGTGTSAYPGNVNRTMPARGKTGAYTYMKAPRWATKACEVGPLARLAVAGIYPVDGTTLWASAPLAAAAGIYFTAGGALDAAMIAPTIYAALANAGLATAATNWIHGLKGGLSTMDRLRARALESVYLVQQMVGTLTKTADGGSLAWASNGWIDDAALTTVTAGSTCRSLPIPSAVVQNWGANEAPRGALMHQAKISGGKITAYQCIVPTTWNGSPQTTTGGVQHGAIEAACIGTGAAAVPFSAAGAVFTKQDGTSSGTVQGGVEVLRIAQSFDPCIACAVH